jgi:hypothetical protein
MVLKKIKNNNNMNNVKYYILRYWVSIIFLGLAFYFYEPNTSITHCSPNSLITDGEPKTLLGLGEMSWMWILMAIAHSANTCYCDIKSLLNKKNK